MHFHTPVLLDEVIEYLNIRKGKKYIDATVGGGGHAVEIVKRGGILLGVDYDSRSVAVATQRIRELEIRELKKSPNLPRRQAGRLVAQSLIVQGNFKNIDEISQEHGFDKVSGILFDLGMSSWQIEESGRGFSFGKDELLDMRADRNLQVTAADLVNGLTAKELYELFQKFGEEKFSRRIAERITKRRRIKRIETTKQLSELITQVYSRSFAQNSRKFANRIHPATRVFQALRIAVNDELNNLRQALPKAVELLEPGGRLVVISFHSLEDRIVKRVMRMMANEGELVANRLQILTKKPLRPTAVEVEKNRRARSAKMRVAEKYC